MTTSKSLPWIEEGYRMVSFEGFNSLNIESIARVLGKSKSSFYHYFGDMEVFETELLDHHMKRVGKFAESIKECQVVQPDVLNVFVEYKDDLFFHKQLRIGRDNPQYKKYMEKAYHKVEEAFIDKWADFLGLDQQKSFAATFLQLIAENFLLQMTEQNFSIQWLEKYLEEVSNLLRQMNSGS